MTTFEKFFKDNPEQKEIYEKEYNDFLLSEFMLEKMQEENLSVRELARQANVSPTVIQKLRSKDAEKVTLTTFTSVLRCLGYKIQLKKISAGR
ncbi:MAG: helix-turn-helix domain-containing protein [Treponema sp.]|nr:helix-turn-helix domain-containing protein [Treponema sp.]